MGFQIAVEEGLERSDRQKRARIFKHDLIVAVLGDEELIGGEQDADAAGAHALERADVAGIAGDTDDDGFTLLSRGGTQAQAAHEQCQREDQRQDLLHEGFLLVVF